MKEYTVIEIADILKTKPSTVRRWIREGQIKAVQESRKQGNVVSEEELQKFLSNNEKYKDIANGSGMVTAITQLNDALGNIKKIGVKENIMENILPALGIGALAAGSIGVGGGLPTAILGGAAVTKLLSKNDNDNNEKKKELTKQEKIENIEKQMQQLQKELEELKKESE